MTFLKIVLPALVFACAGIAQHPPAPGMGVRGGVFEHAVPPPHMFVQAAPVEGMRQLAIDFIGAEVGGAGKVVKGAPYSAESVTESIQTLADGNRIRHKTSAQVYRDNEGRTRREAAFGMIGMAPETELPQIVFITDPVAGETYVLNLKERTAQKAKIVPPHERLAAVRAKLEASPADERRVELKVAAAEGGREEVAVRSFSYRATASADMHSAKNESLGRQVIEGVPADGTRTTITIPAGKVGNERPIEIVSERWYSPELQMIVLSKHNDPRSGETVHRITNISRSEPPRTLFEVPADFKLTENKGEDVIRMRLPHPPK